MLEHDILLSIYDDLIINIVNIKNAKLRNSCINNDIKLLNKDTNLFTDKCQQNELFNHYLHAYSSDNDTYEKLLTNLETLLAQTKHDIIQMQCSHKWLDDWVDTDPDTSQQIRYCSKCNKTTCK